MSSVATIDDVRSLLSSETGLVTAAVIGSDSTPVLTVVNAGVIEHPLSGDPCIGFVAVGGSRKLEHLRREPYLSMLVRRGWRWVAAEGAVDLIGPDDPSSGMVTHEILDLIRSIYTAAGGRHDNWDEFDRVMAEERRCAVLLTPRRIYTNPNRPV